MENKDSLYTPKRLWQAWKRIAAQIAHVQGNLVLGLIYLVVVTPSACLFRLFRKNPLALAPGEQSSYWIQRSPLTSVLEFLKKEY